MFCERGADYVPVYALPRTWDGKDKKEATAEARSNLPLNAVQQAYTFPAMRAKEKDTTLTLSK